MQSLSRMNDWIKRVVCISDINSLVCHFVLIKADNRNILPLPWFLCDRKHPASFFHAVGQPFIHTRLQNTQRRRGAPTWNQKSQGSHVTCSHPGPHTTVHWCSHLPPLADRNLEKATVHPKGRKNIYQIKSSPFSDAGRDRFFSRMPLARLQTSSVPSSPLSVRIFNSSVTLMKFSTGRQKEERLRVFFLSQSDFEGWCIGTPG